MHITTVAGTQLVARSNHFGSGVSVVCPIAWISILLEASIGPMSSSGRTIGQGNLVDANAMLKNAGNTIATSQRMVFHFKRLFLSVFFISQVFRRDRDALLGCVVVVRQGPHRKTRMRRWRPKAWGLSRTIPDRCVQLAQRRWVVPYEGQSPESSRNRRTADPHFRWCGPRGCLSRRTRSGFNAIVQLPLGPPQF